MAPKAHTSSRCETLAPERRSGDWNAGSPAVWATSLSTPFEVRGTPLVITHAGETLP